MALMEQVNAKKIDEGKYEIVMPDGKVITMNSSGKFDNERELMRAAEESGNLLAIADDDCLKRYFLIYEHKTYDVVMPIEDMEKFDW